MARHREPPRDPGPGTPRRRPRAWWLWPLAALALAAGCGKDEAGYFPLGAGLSWGYRITVETRGAGTRRYKSFVANRPRQSLGDEEATPRLFHDGLVFYYAETPDGIRRIASRKPGDGVAWAPPGGYVLKYPVQVGTGWRAASRTYLAKDRITFDILSLLTAEVDVDYAIEAVDGVVTVPAGTFRNCVKVHGYGETRIDLGPGYNRHTIVIESLEWFAPGVGLVKMVRREVSRPEVPGNSTLVKELETFDGGSWFN